MKKLFLSSLIVVSFLFGKAQSSSPISFAGGFRLGLPVGDFGEAWAFGIGAEVEGEAKIASNVAIPFSAGYTRFIGKKFLGERVPGIGLIPILAGIRIYPASNFFIGGKLGYGILTADGESEGAFNYEPQIGYNSQRYRIGFGYNGLTKDGETIGHLALVTVFKF